MGIQHTKLFLGMDWVNVTYTHFKKAEVHVKPTSSIFSKEWAACEQHASKKTRQRQEIIAKHMLSSSLIYSTHKPVIFKSKFYIRIIPVGQKVSMIPSIIH